MGVIYCGNCEGKVSDILDRCPHCCHPMTDQGSADLDRPVRIELTSKSIKLVTVTGAIMAVAGAAVAAANWHIDGSEKTKIGVVVAVAGVVVFLGARISAWWGHG